MMQDTSIPVVRGLRARKHTDQVLDAIQAFGPVTNLELSRGLGMPINTITPATNALVKSGQVVESHRAASPITGVRSIFWKVAA